MPLLVIGATGFIGPHVVHSLAGHRDALAAVRPDVVIDMVPYTAAQARQAADVFAGVAGRLIAVSSGDVYRNDDGWRGVSDHAPDPVPLDEEAPLRRAGAAPADGGRPARPQRRGRGRCPRRTTVTDRSSHARTDS